MSGPGPKPKPLRFIGCGHFHYVEFIRVVGLDSKLSEYAGVVGLGRLFVLMAYVGVGCPFRSLGQDRYRLCLSRPRLYTWLP